MKHLSLLLLFLITLTGYTQEQELVAHWEKGDSYDFEVTKIKKKYRAGKLYDNDSTTFVTSFKVLEKGPTSYTLQWRYENDLLDKLKLPLSVKNTYADFKVTEVIYKTNDKGMFLEILNWEAIAQKMATLKKGLLGSLGMNSDADKVFQQNVNVLLQVYSSKEGIEQLVVKELQAFHFAYGVNYRLNQPITFTQQLPNMFGGAPIRGEATARMTQLEAAKKELKIQYNMKANEEDAKRMIKDFLNKMKLDDQKMKKAFAESTIKLEDNNTFNYDYELGIPNNINFLRTVDINLVGDQGKQTEKVKIKRILK